MTHHRRWIRHLSSLALAAALLASAGCESDQEDPAYVTIHNDFDNPEMSYNPPWTICDSYYAGTFFGKVGIGEMSEEKEVEPGVNHVLFVAAWDDPECNPENCLPIATRNEEEVVPGQHRTIAINMPNHQGPCPPEGISPIPQELYDRILELWPEYGFLPYDQRTENAECLD